MQRLLGLILLVTLASACANAPDSPTDGGTATGGDDASTAGEDAGAACGPFDQATCPAGQKCTLDSTAHAACMTAGTKGDYEQCSSEKECASGFTCARYPGGVSPVCIGFCDPSHPCLQTTGKETCALKFPGSTFTACARSCDLFGQDCHNQLEGCYLGASGEPSCYGAGAKKAAESCQFVNECARGLACVLTAGGGVCHPLCDPAALTAGPDAGLLDAGAADAASTVDAAAPELDGGVDGGATQDAGAATSDGGGLSPTCAAGTQCSPLAPGRFGYCK